MTEQTPETSDTPAAQPGWTRLLFKSKFGAGRDFEVSDADGNRVMFVDGKVGVRPKAEVRDNADGVLYQVTGRFGGIPKEMHITRPDGTEVAFLKAKFFSPVKDTMNLNLADGRTLQVQGTILEKNYSILADGEPVARISQKWMTMRDKYAVEFRDEFDAGLVMAVIWAIDRWVERD